MDDLSGLELLTSRRRNVIGSWPSSGDGRNSTQPHQQTQQHKGRSGMNQPNVGKRGNLTGPNVPGTSRQQFLSQIQKLSTPSQLGAQSTAMLNRRMSALSVHQSTINLSDNSGGRGDHQFGLKKSESHNNLFRVATISNSQATQKYRNVVSTAGILGLGDATGEAHRLRLQRSKSQNNLHGPLNTREQVAHLFLGTQNKTSIVSDANVRVLGGRVSPSQQLIPPLMSLSQNNLFRGTRDQVTAIDSRLSVMRCTGSQNNVYGVSTQSGNDLQRSKSHQNQNRRGQGRGGDHRRLSRDDLNGVLNISQAAKRQNSTGVQGRGNFQNNTIENILSALLGMEDQDVVFRLQFEKRGLDEILPKVKKSPQMLPTFIAVLAKVCRCQIYQQNVIQTLELVLKSDFFMLDFCQYLAVAPHQLNVQVNWNEFFNNLVLVFQKFLNVFPNKASEVLAVAISISADKAKFLSGRLINGPLLLEHLTDIQNQGVANLSKFDCPSQKQASEQELESLKLPPNDFRHKSVVLCSADIHEAEIPFLRSNIVKGSYNSVEHYLDVQFRLLREDFVAPLKDGILDYMILHARNKTDNIKLKDLKLYTNVQVAMIDKTPFEGIIHKLSFDLTKLKFVTWKMTKRFLHGSLVCLSSDHFVTFRLAIIVKRDPVELAKGYVSIKFLEETFWEIDSNEIFVMVESPTYFEAYQPILKGLISITEDSMPFINNIVKAETKINLPSYLKRDSIYNLSCMSDKAKKYSLTCYPFFSDRWPDKSQLNLDESQHSALAAALSREIAIIQGPPGTGKTFLGMKIVQVLLENKPIWSNGEDSPILVICYTNHALDQFLEEIMKFVPTGIVRVGGQSKSEALKAFNINNLKRNMGIERKVPEVVHKSRFSTMLEIHSIADELNQHLMDFDRGLNFILSRDELNQNDVFSDQHFEQFEVYEGKNCVKSWLGLNDLREKENDDVYNTTQQLHNIVGNTGNEGVESDDEEVGMEDILAEEDMANRIEDDEDWLEDDPWVPQTKMAVRDLKNRQMAAGIKSQNEIFWPEVGPRGQIYREDELYSMMGGQNEEWEITAEERKRRKNQMKAELRKTDRMSDAEVEAVVNIHVLSIKNRWRLYRYWVAKLRATKLQAVVNLQKEYENSCEKLKEVSQMFEKKILEQAVVIGMTTTGAAKHREVLQEVQPSIIIVEEAAEVLEAHVVTALSKKCKHLVLIGDQQQLRPSPTVYKLAKDYKLDVSLFERLINNGLPYERLLSQHRMRPEIAKLLVPNIYENLKNHSSVEEYENIGGMRKNVYFLDHRHEEASVSDSKSKSNEFEAQMIIALCRYLLLQGYKPEQITILSTYLGQVFLIKQKMKNTIVKDVQCTVVDNFQGEENDIILLSLVRSNRINSVGFLKIENRVCVALSRARKGLYCIGNFELLASTAPVWVPIVGKLLKADEIGPSFPLHCQNHPDTVNEVKCCEDFDKVPEGGCLLPCEYRMPCGHQCEKVCHVIDRKHTEIKCNKPCSKELCKLGHKCQRKCHQECGPCFVPVKKMSSCGHTNFVPCHKELSEYSCRQPCEKSLFCGHCCTSACGDVCNDLNCYVLRQVKSPCGHIVSVPCKFFEDPKKMLLACKTKCNSILSCEHKCAGNCYDCKQMRIHVRCREKCGRTLVCGHSCNVPCAETCPPCRQQCQNRCIHSKCPNKCGDMCQPCREPCAWRCKHLECTKLCHEQCDREPCPEPCSMLLPCGHPCIGHCGEPCPTKCRVCNEEEVCETFFGDEDEKDAKFVLLEDCGHVIESGGMDRWMAMDSSGTGTEINLKSCPKCKTVIRKNLRYGNIVKALWNDIVLIKNRIMMEHKNLRQEMYRMRAKANRALPKITMFGAATRQLTAQCEFKHLSAFDVNLCNNKINFLLKMAALWKCKQPRGHFAVVRENLTELEDVLVNIVRKTAAEEVLQNFAQELKRVEYLCNVIKSVQDRSMNHNATICFNDLCTVLTSKSPFTAQQEEIVKKMIEQLESLQSGLGISQAEKTEVVKAMGLTQGHWFKCPKGHIYAIGECGGAMEEGKCPECGSKIGGQHHQLTASNSLASEMDGAIAPAYPTFRRY